MGNNKKHICGECEFFDDGFVFPFCWFKKNYDDNKMRETDKACDNFKATVWQ